MATKHVTIYECDACGAQVQEKTDLATITYRTKDYDLCHDCESKLCLTILNKFPEAEEDRRARPV